MAILLKVPSTLDFEQIAQVYPCTGLSTKARSPEYLFYYGSMMATIQTKRGSHDNLKNLTKSWKEILNSGRCVDNSINYNYL